MPSSKTVFVIIKKNVMINLVVVHHKTTQSIMCPIM